MVKRTVRFLSCFIVLYGWCHVASARTNVPYLIIYPAKWESALTNYMAFKSRLGFRVYTNTIEHITSGDTNNYELLRSYLTDFRTNTVPTNSTVYVLFFGNYFSIPAPTFRISPDDGSTYYSDLYHRDLYTEFDSDGDRIFAEYGNISTSDFDSASFNAAFPSISNDIVVGRIPIHQSWDAGSAETVLNHIMDFEKETGARKNQSIMSAGRISTLLNFCDSWDYVLEDLVSDIEGTYPEKQIVTVVHIPSNHADTTGMDYTVEGDDITACYTEGQDIIRGLWETNDACSFLCNVSHGGAYYDFAIRRNGAGFPTNVQSAIILSMSCASYKLGKAALTNGLCATYLGSSATVTPDTDTLFFFEDMVSARVQRRAAEKIFCQNMTVGQTFQDEFSYYVENIQTAGFGTFYSGSKDAILRNVVGFQITGDPTLVHAYSDTDGDGLLDPEEVTLGTGTNQWDTDGDGIPDGMEVENGTTDPRVHDGNDVDEDHVSNTNEIIAGTNPFSGTSYPCIENLNSPTSMVFTFAWETVTGRTYRIQNALSLVTPAWTNCSPEWSGTGGPMQFGVTNPPADYTMYRLLISR